MALVVRHLERGERYEHLADEPFAAASTIKLPILVALYDAAARGAVRLERRRRLRPEDQVTGSGVLQLLTPGVRLPLRDLAELMITVSDNAATNMILEVLGIEQVNACLAGLGLRHTRVHRPLQVVPVGAGTPNTVTAGELAELLERLATGRLVSWEACRRMVATLKRQQLNDALPALLPQPEGTAVGALPAWEFAHKTGGIPGHQHDVGLLYLPGQTIVVCVLTRGCGPAREARRRIAEVGRAVFDAYA
jgi:beta-lactamase class A